MSVLGHGVVICTSTTRPTPISGSLIYETDTNKLMFWNGFGWVNPMKNQLLDTTSLQSGVVKNIYYAQKSGRQDIVSTSPQWLTGLRVYITPLSSLSRFLLLATINHNGEHVHSFGFFRNGSRIHPYQGANTNEDGMFSTGYHGWNANTSYMTNTHLSWMDSPNTDGYLEYDIRGTAGWAGVNYTMRINDRNADMRSYSTLTVLEF